MLRAAVVALDGAIADVLTGENGQRWEGGRGGGIRVNCEGKRVLRRVLPVECFRFEWCGGRNNNRSRGFALVFHLALRLHCDALGSRWYHGAIVNFPDAVIHPLSLPVPPTPAPTHGLDSSGATHQQPQQQQQQQQPQQRQQQQRREQYFYSHRNIAITTAECDAQEGLDTYSYVEPGVVGHITASPGQAVQNRHEWHEC